MGKHPLPIERPAYPLLTELRLDAIIGVHPAVLKMLQQFPAESIFGLRGVSDALIDDVYWIPRIAVVPVRGGGGYWCWIGVRAYRRLVDCGWRGKITVLNYGPRMPEQKIVNLAHKDWIYASAITGPAQTTDWAFAHLWEANSDYACRPVKPGNGRRRSGLNTYADLRELGRRRLRADKAIRAPKSTDRPRSATEEEGTED